LTIILSKIHQLRICLTGMVGEGEQHCTLPERGVGETTLLEHLAVKTEVPQNEAVHESEDLVGTR
jgi:hypothetical protein